MIRLAVPSMAERCDICVIRGICFSGEVCRFRWCRTCNVPMYMIGDRWVQCPLCGFTNRSKRVRRLGSFKVS